MLMDEWLNEMQAASPVSEIIGCFAIVLIFLFSFSVRSRDAAREDSARSGSGHCSDDVQPSRGERRFGDESVDWQGSRFATQWNVHDRDGLLRYRQQPSHPEAAPRRSEYLIKFLNIPLTPIANDTPGGSSRVYILFTLDTYLPFYPLLEKRFPTWMMMFDARQLLELDSYYLGEWNHFLNPNRWLLHEGTSSRQKAVTWRLIKGKSDNPRIVRRRFERLYPHWRRAWEGKKEAFNKTRKRKK